MYFAYKKPFCKSSEARVVGECDCIRILMKTLCSQIHYGLDYAYITKKKGMPFLYQTMRSITYIHSNLKQVVI